MMREHYIARPRTQSPFVDFQLLGSAAESLGKPIHRRKFAASSRMECTVASSPPYGSTRARYIRVLLVVAPWSVYCD